jgi:hypothetical protein
MAQIEVKRSGDPSPSYGPERMKAAQSRAGAVAAAGSLRPPSGSGAVLLKSKPRSTATWPIWSGFRYR